MNPREFVPVTSIVALLVGGCLPALEQQEAPIPAPALAYECPPGQVAEDPEPGQRENLGPCINSAEIEVMPRFSPDGKRLYFVRAGSPDNVGGRGGGEDIWFAERAETGDWTVLHNPGAPLNSEGHAFVAAILDDGDRLLIGHTQLAPDDGTSAFSFISREGDAWGEPEPLLIEDWHTLSPWVAASLTEDGSTLVFHAERTDGMGGTDLYVTFLQEDGSWSAPLNLGPEINTTGSEITPYLMPDGETLYFSSDGHGGLGGQDIFITQRLDESWKRWSTPENLGPRFNTTGFDAYFIAPRDSEYGYLASTDGARGTIDLFRIILQEPEPEPTILVHGKVINEDTGDPIGASVRYSSREESGQTISDPVTGAFTVALPEGALYTFQAEAARYLGASAQIDGTLTSPDANREFELTLHLIPIREGARLVLRHVFFDLGSANLRPESEAELLNIVDALQSNREIRVEIQGHTDSTGSRALNDRLSTARAESVRSYLIEMGVAPGRIEAKGYGPTVPVATNETEEGRQLNRRVELRVLGES